MPKKVEKKVEKKVDKRDPHDIPEIDSNSVDCGFKEGVDTNSLDGYKELDTN